MVNFHTGLRTRLRGCAAAILATAVAMLAPCVAVARNHGGRHLQTQSDAEYVSALATANRFLYAWQTHDEEAGVLLLSDGAKKRSSEDKVATFFSAAAMATYEIGRGKKLKPGLYAFPLALYESNSAKESHCHPHYSQLTVARTGKEDWAIDTLP